MSFPRSILAAALLCATPALAAASETQIALGDRYEGFLDGSSEPLDLVFTDLAGTAFSTSIKGGRGAELALELLDQTQGLVLDLGAALQGEGSTSLRLMSFALPSTGRYRLRIENEGAERVSIQCQTARKDARANLRRSEADELASPRDTRAFSFLALGGAELSASVKTSGSPAWDPALAYLETPSRVRVDLAAHASSRRGRADLKRWRVPAETGAYTLHVSARGGSAGRFAITLAIKNPASRVLHSSGGGGPSSGLRIRSAGRIDASPTGFEVRGLVRTSAQSSAILYHTGSELERLHMLSFSHASGSWSSQRLSHAAQGSELDMLPVGDGRGGAVVSGSEDEIFHFRPGAAVLRQQLSSPFELRQLASEAPVLVSTGGLLPGQVATLVLDPATRAWQANLAPAFSSFASEYGLLAGPGDALYGVDRDYRGFVIRRSRLDGTTIEQRRSLDVSFSVACEFQGVSRGPDGLTLFFLCDGALGAELYVDRCDALGQWTGPQLVATRTESVSRDLLRLHADAAADGSAVALIVIPRPFSFQMVCALGRGGPRGPWTWEEKTVPIGFAEVCIAEGGDAVAILGSFAPPNPGVRISGARAGGRWSEPRPISPSALPVTDVRRPCLPIGPNGTGPFLAVAVEWVGTTISLESYVITP